MIKCIYQNKQDWFFASLYYRERKKEEEKEEEKLFITILSEEIETPKICV